MTRYLIRRLLLVLPTVLGVTTVVFVVMRMLPADVARLIAGDDASEQQVAQVRTSLGLDRPLPVQYVEYVRNAVSGNLGQSIYSARPVTELLLPRFRNTVYLALMSICIAAALGLALGAVAALRQGSVIDNLASVFASAGLAIPNFWLALILIFIFAERLRILSALASPTPKGLILPSIGLGLHAMAIVARMTRAVMIDVLREDYVRTARAKGLAARIVIVRHTLRNAMIPILTVIGLQAGFLVGGSIVVETVFAYPGIGYLIYQSISTRDFPIVQGGVLLTATAVIVISLVVDLSYAVIDPRVRYA